MKILGIWQHWSRFEKIFQFWFEGPRQGPRSLIRNFSVGSRFSRLLEGPSVRWDKTTTATHTRWLLNARHLRNLVSDPSLRRPSFAWAIDGWTSELTVFLIFSSKILPGFCGQKFCLHYSCIYSQKSPKTQWTKKATDFRKFLLTQIEASLSDKAQNVLCNSSTFLRPRRHYQNFFSTPPANNKETPKRYRVLELQRQYVDQSQ